jgi:hypothetical protein
VVQIAVRMRGLRARVAPAALLWATASDPAHAQACASAAQPWSALTTTWQARTRQ